MLFEWYHLAPKKDPHFYTNVFHPQEPSPSDPQAEIHLLVLCPYRYDTGDKIEDIYTLLCNTYNESDKSEPTERFEDALNAANELFVQSDIDPTQCSIIVALNREPLLCLSSIGTVNATLLRAGTVYPIRTEQDQEPCFNSLSPGILEEGDIVFLAVGDTLRACQEQVLSQSFENGQSFMHNLEQYDESAQQLCDFPLEMIVLHAESGDTTDAPAVMNLFQTHWEKVRTTAGEITQKISPRVTRTWNQTTQKIQDAGRRLRGDDSTEAPLGIYAKNALQQAGTLSEKLQKNVESRAQKTSETIKDIWMNESLLKHPKSLFETVAERFGALTERGRGLPVVVQTLTVFVTLLVVAMGSFWIYDRYESGKEAAARLTDFDNQLSQAKTRMIYDKKGVQTMLPHLEKELTLIQTLDPSLNIDEQKAALSDMMAKSLNIQHVGEKSLRLVKDLSSQRAEMALRGGASLGGQLFVFDKNTLYTLVMDEVRSQKIAEDADLKSITAFDEQESLLLYSQDKRLWEIKNGAVLSATTRDAGFKSASTIEDFNKFLYLLDNTTGQIWKYTKQTE